MLTFNSINLEGFWLCYGEQQVETALKRRSETRNPPSRVPYLEATLLPKVASEPRKKMLKMTRNELEQMLDKSWTEHFQVGASIEASQPGRYAFVQIRKYVWRDALYLKPRDFKPYRVWVGEFSNIGLHPQSAIQQLDFKDDTAVRKLMVEIEGHTIDSRGVESLDEVETFLKQMGRSLEDIDRSYEF